MATPTSGASGASNQAILWAGIIGSVVFAGAVAFVTLRDAPEDVPPAEAVAAPQPAAPVVAMETPPAAEQAAEPVTAVDDAVAQAAAPETPTESAAVAAAPAPIPPKLDVVRVDAEGNAVIAGQAAPGDSVVLRLDGEILDTVTADNAGNFVAMLAIDPSDLARVLSLEAVGADGTVTAGGESVLIAPFAAPIAQVAADTGAAPSGADAGSQLAAGVSTVDPAATAVAPQAAEAAPAEITAAAQETSATATADVAATTVTPAEPSTQQTEQVASATAQAAAPAEMASAEAAAAAPQAPAVLIAGQDGIRVAQGAEDQGGTTVQLDAITYDDEGGVTLAGRGLADAELRLMLDDREVSTATVDAGGQWSVPLSDVAAGTYTLRIEQLDANGGVAATVQTPFLREDPARIRENPMLAAPGSSVITVQRGFTLWGIAEANFGNGILYVQIFQENRGDIRDPDLIFPGQIFALPDLPRTGTAP
ncbi:LysM peptidoglycan-binding domain-containing protein [Roseicyclus sp.]|uniref:LysM peptidoglycan-binding domain-containing protein n=1 Tax=Roseicyclus sp. TaxID=1914329 RepID=UPI003F6CB957